MQADFKGFRGPTYPRDHGLGLGPSVGWTRVGALCLYLSNFQSVRICRCLCLFPCPGYHMLSNGSWIIFEIRAWPSYFDINRCSILELLVGEPVVWTGFWISPGGNRSPDQPGARLSSVSRSINFEIWTESPVYRPAQGPVIFLCKPISPPHFTIFRTVH